MGVLWAAEAGTAANDGGGYWHLAMVLAAIGLLGVFARWRKMRSAPPPDTREFRERDREPDRYRDVADRAIVELLETSHSLNAQVDTKIRVLNRLVKEAEEQSAKLEKLLAAAREPVAEGGGGGAPAPVAPREENAPPTPAPAFRSELQQRIHLLRSEGKSMAEIAKVTSLSTTEVRFAIESMKAESPHDQG